MVYIKDMIRNFSVVGLVISVFFGAIYYLQHSEYAEVISLFGLAIFDVFGLTYIFVYKLINEKILKSDEVQGIICESDGYPSLSRAQFLIWTFVIGVVFMWVLLLKIWYVYENSKVIDISTLSMPDNLLWLMGISSFTAIASKGLSSFKYKGTQKNQGTQKNPAESQNLWTMFMENGKLSLTRYQMFLWTVISVLTYFGLLLGNIFNNYSNLGVLTFPDFPQVLLALMGVSQATYLGGKFAFQPPDASISRIVPDGRKIGDIITILGFNFGKNKASVLFEGNIEADIQDWQDSKIIVKIPEGIEMEEGFCDVQVVTGSGTTTLPYEYYISGSNTTTGSTTGSATTGNTTAGSTTAGSTNAGNPAT